MSDSVRLRHEAQLSEELHPLWEPMNRLGASDLAANESGVFFHLPGSGWPRSDVYLPWARRELVVTLSASLLGTEIHAAQPYLSGEIQHLDVRIQASIPPLSPSPEFVLRRPPAKTFPVGSRGSSARKSTERGHL